MFTGIFFASTFVLILCMLYFIYETVVQGKALSEDCKTFEELMSWRLANPELCIGDISYARNLVLKRIAAYEHFVKVCSFVKRDEEHVKFLYSLLDEHGGEPPRKTKGKRKQLKKLSCFIFDI